MTSPTQPPKESIKDRISTRLSTDKKGRLIDADAQHTRNVSWVFYGLIAVTVVILALALGYGYWESNLKPLANVDGTEVSRSDWEDRQKLEQFRADRAESQVSTALAEGTIESALANRRFNNIAADQPAASEVMTELVDLLFKQQLAQQEGIELSDADLDEALAADGTFAEARFIEALIVMTAEQESGAAASTAGSAEARTRAEAALTELRDGADYEALAETYGPADAQSAYVTRDDLNEATWGELIFAAEEGDVTEVVQAETGEQLIARVTTIVPAQTDPGFIEAVNDEVGGEIHRRNVELEATAAALEEQITTTSVEAEYDQVRLAEIFLESSPFADPETDTGDVRASHILYAPETPLDEDGEPTEVAELAEDDPAWAEAQLEAERAARQLVVVEDVDTRIDAFAQRAANDSDGPSASSGGDLGYFTREAMVPEFADAIWEAEDPQRGDILGPVRSDFGWHVIMFDQFRAPLADRLAEVQVALAEDGADFATVAAEYSDGATAPDGGELDWQRLDELDDTTILAISVIEDGDATDPIEQFDGTYIYQKLEEATRPLDPEDAAAIAATAFSDWYDDLYYDAQDADRISIDDSVYE